ncbi:WD and tetratricopeptide repeats protein 1-like [Acanthaster planci]|uniref:WD and tetratricopeptide repeats protein 1-like n=1 Tax=Acanthaster planci TaxID=133434 RepID=A0A8B7YC23_ACAPL|nr:WD and tetratricopeptide repeats protein 1-like [Acanthaster planci]
MEPKDAVSTVKHIFHRQIKDTFCLSFQRSHHVDEALINRLGLLHELEGHSGCVNCLEWNYSGRLLGSGSDDFNAIVWDPHRRRRLCVLRTGHHGNIFSVKFLPNANDETLVTGAADCKVRIHSLPSQETTHAFSCHAGRVKRLAVAPSMPYMFWSAGEDGTVRQFDLRAPHTCNDSCANVLINLNCYIGKHAECKCLAINPNRPELMAVGASDAYVRLYDVRMLSPHAVHFSREERLGASWRTPAPEPDDSGLLPRGCVQYLVAGHLPLKENDRKRKYRSLVSTYVTFSPSGRELLVNLGGEQVYLFDLYNLRHPKAFNVGDYVLPEGSNGVCKEVSSQVAEALSANGTSIGSTNGVTKHLSHASSYRLQEGSPSTGPGTSRELPPRAEALKQEGNRFYCDMKDYTSAIRLFNQALGIAPNSAILYGNRAAAFMRRKWDGDLYAALRDCHRALALDPSHRKAHFRLARCLLELTWAREAQDCLKQYKRNYPEFSKHREFEALDRDITTAVFSMCDSDSSTSDKEKAETSPRRRWNNPDRISDEERILRSQAYDYAERFCGHCNTTTDIKEANFFGSNGQFIIAGSDDGSFFVWDRKTTNIVRVLRGDESIVNCLQPHPSFCLLATSGIDPVVRLWGPKAQDGKAEERCIREPDTAATANQRRMNADPLEVMLMNMGYRITGMSDGSDDEGGDGPVQCNTS